MTYAPSASAEIRAQTDNLAKSIDALYGEMIGASDKQYVTYADKYAAINAEIQSIKLKNQFRLHSTNLQNMIGTIEIQFGQYQADHKAKGVLTAGQLRAYKNDMAGFCLPLIKSENLLK